MHVDVNIVLELRRVGEADGVHLIDDHDAFHHIPPGKYLIVNTEMQARPISFEVDQFHGPIR